MSGLAAATAALASPAFGSDDDEEQARGGPLAPAPLGGGSITAPSELARIARERGSGQPMMFLDLAAFDQNFRIISDFARKEGWALRPALKSFQSPQFIGYTLWRLPKPRGLIFSLRTVDDVLAYAPDGTDLQMGYPPTLGELEAYLESAPPRRGPRATVRILIDSVELLEACARFARRSRRGLPIDVALNLESGMRLSALRGPGDLSAALRVLRANRSVLRLSGIMCYDGHGAYQGDVNFRRSVVADTQRQLAAWLQQLELQGTDLYDEATLVRNGPGSSTYQQWAGSTLINDISPGAAFLDHGYVTQAGHDNQGLAPTLHQAAPVHRIGGTFPDAPFFVQGVPADPTLESIGCRGGAWPSNDGSLTEAVHPPGLREDEFSGGRGNNQSWFFAAKGTVRRGDYVVLRPKHAGDAFDYFQHVTTVRSGAARAVWSTLPRA